MSQGITTLVTLGAAVGEANTLPSRHVTITQTHHEQRLVGETMAVGQGPGKGRVLAKGGRVGWHRHGRLGLGSNRYPRTHPGCMTSWHRCEEMHTPCLAQEHSFTAGPGKHSQQASSTHRVVEHAGAFNHDTTKAQPCRAQWRMMCAALTCVVR